MTHTAVYRFYDAGERLLYVGMTGNTKVRWAWHKANAPWWPDQQRVEVNWHDSRPLAAAEEFRAILTERPIWNRAHTRAAGRAPYSPPNAEMAARIDRVVELNNLRAAAKAEYKATLAEVIDKERGGVPVAHMATRIGVERKTLYRHLGRSMS